MCDHSIGNLVGILIICVVGYGGISSRERVIIVLLDFTISIKVNIVNFRAKTLKIINEDPENVVRTIN